MAFLTDATPAHEIWQYEGSTSIEDHDVAFVNHSRHRKQRLADLGTLECHSVRDVALHRVVRCGLSLSILPDCLSFHLLGPRIVVLSTGRFDGFKSTFGQSSGFTTDSPAPESAVISRCRPRSPSVATGLLSMDMLPIVTAFRSTSPDHHSPSLELSLGRSSPSLKMSYCGTLIGRRRYKLQLLAHRTDREVH